MDKIALCGSSGCGKTALARELSRRLDIPYIPMSQSGKFKPEVIDLFKHETGGLYEPHIRHEAIVHLSNRFPSFGLEFQLEVLRMRTEMIKFHPRFITDRSPVDCLVYFLTQSSIHTTKEFSREFVSAVRNSLSELDSVALLYPNPSGYVEDDRMRVVNPIYQGFIHGVFEYVMGAYFKVVKPKVLYIRDWDWDTRVDLAMMLLKT